MSFDVDEGSGIMGRIKALFSKELWAVLLSRLQSEAKSFFRSLNLNLKSIANSSLRKTLRQQAATTNIAPRVA